MALISGCDRCLEQNHTFPPVSDMLPNLKRQHNRTSFFKYMPALTAKSVLENGTLRWSSPVLFNDPFDVPRELLFGVTPKKIREALAARLTLLINHPPDDTSELRYDLKLIVDAVKRGISQDERAKVIAGIEATCKMQKPLGDSLEELRDQWRSRIPEFRILCLSESPEHAAMWYHYADKYKGVVLEFSCIDELDSAWLLARPINYTALPEIFEVDAWAKLLMKPNKLAVQSIFDAATYTKSPDWSYEREWRISSFKHSNEAGLSSHYKFQPRELSSIYLGPLISAEDKASMISAAATYSHARTFSADVGMSGSIVFNEIHG